jgi:hypothetical protein
MDIASYQWDIALLEMSLSMFGRLWLFFPRYTKTMAGQ